MKVVVTCIAVLVATGCTHPAPAPPALDASVFLKKKWSPTRAYQIDYIDHAALDREVAVHGSAPVRDALGTAFREIWPHIAHLRVAGGYAMDLLTTMERLAPSSGQTLIDSLMPDRPWMPDEPQETFYEHWIREKRELSL